MNIGKIGPSFTGFLTLNLENMDEGGSRRERLNTNNIIRINMIMKYIKSIARRQKSRYTHFGCFCFYRHSPPCIFYKDNKKAPSFCKKEA